MTKLHAALQQLTGEGLVEALVEFMEEHFEDFPDVRQRYLSAVATLEKELPSIRQEVAAIHHQAAAMLLFSGYLGLKANLDHFTDPVGRDFLDVDPEVYLRETAARRLPDYRQAQEVREQFAAMLTPSQQEIYQDIGEYVIYLETVGPKLAHYYGYLQGNELLGKIILGYFPDMGHTMRYEAAVEGYFGERISLLKLSRRACW